MAENLPRGWAELLLCRAKNRVGGTAVAGWRGYLQQLGWWLAHRLWRGPERVLARQHDALGELRVTQAGELRYLYFGEETEQSCALIGNPAWLEYDYTRAMLLAGFWLPQIERALALGLLESLEIVPIAVGVGLVAQQIVECEFGKGNALVHGVQIVRVHGRDQLTN